MRSPLQGNYLLGDTCRLTEASPGVLHYKTLWISRHCLAVSVQRVSLAREECVRLGWEGHNPNATFPCVAYTLRPVSDEISHFSRQTAMPLTGRSLFTEQTTPCSTVSWERTRYTQHGKPFRQTFLWEVVDCHFTLPLCSCRVGFSPPTF